ncbi:serine/threonine-protein phosphatase [Streptomyces sp. NBC_00820]|uniref:PP2C family protein-serine/threonine phosphatase n=1 Tax=Streptomyces sp. NBC_00820 TaxID=2975842 RepID=UPI002ED41B26|nr:serine/threonine-protein phosphatase [Streptomyces sp. NBC_00820]
MKRERDGVGPEGDLAVRTHLPTPPAWMRWLPLLYVVAVLLLEPVTPVDWPVSFVLIALPLVTAFAHGPTAVACATVGAIVLEGLLAGTPCCAGRPVGYLWDRHYVAAYVCTALVGALGMAVAAHRTRRERTLADVRFVAEVAQRVLLKPVPHRLGGLALDSLYLAAAAEARIGGDLYEAVLTRCGVRLVIGDVRGKGLLAVETAGAMLAAFREAAHDEPGLPGLADRVERSMSRRAAQLGGSETGERFVTAVFVEVPLGEHVVRVVNCGHPPPLRIRPGDVRELDRGRSGPPLNLGMLVPDPFRVDTYSFRPGDELLLFTDGVTETRNADGRFYPLAERLASWGPLDPEKLLDRLHRDLLVYSGDQLQDDTAALAAHRLPDEPTASAEPAASTGPTTPAGPTEQQ